MTSNWFDKVVKWTLAFVCWVTLCIGIAGTIALVTEKALADELPQVKMKSGRYYLSVNNERYQEYGKVKYYTLDTTAKAAATNLSFKMGVPVIIEQPDITVTAVYTVPVPDVPEEGEKPLTVTWSPPTERTNGAGLGREEISGYLLMIDDDTIEIDGADTTEYVIKGLTPGRYEIKVAAIAGTMSSYSEVIYHTIY